MSQVAINQWRVAPAMEDLPSDVVQLVIHKLATQDPASLLSMTCACASFHREAEANPSVWREAFFAPFPQAERGASKSLGGKWSADLEAEVQALAGGYRQLVIARWAAVARGLVSKCG